MNPATNQPETGRRPIDLLSPEARKALKNSRRAFRRSATARDRIRSTEDRLRDWERRVVAKGSSARRWRSLLEEGLTLIADTGGVQLEVRQVEQQGLKFLRAGMEALHEVTRDSQNGSAERAYDLLDRCERLRAEELGLIDATLAATHGILNLPRSAAPDQVLGMLEERRKVVTRIDRSRRQAEQLERQAIGVLTGTTIPDPGSKKGETSMPARKKRNTAPVEAPPAPETPAPTEPEEPVTDQPVLGPLDAIPASLRRTADHLESIRLEVEGRLAALIERLEVNHAAALEEEARLRGEVEEQLEQMRDERREFEERVAAAESAAGELRTRMKNLEEEVREERERLAAERTALDARVRASERERDEALVLVASLSRRLKTPGIDEAIGGDAGEA